EMREVEVELVRRYIGALRHEAHVAERARIDDGLVVGWSDGIELAGRRVVDEVEEAREAVAEVEAAPAAMADVEDAMHLRLDLGHVVVRGILPVDAMARRRLEA